MNLIKTLAIAFTILSISVLKTYGTDEVLSAGASTFAAKALKISGTVNVATNSVASQAMEATAAIASVISSTAILTDGVTCSAADIVDVIVTRACTSLNRISEAAGKSALNIIKEGTASITREVKQALDEINAVAKETGAEIADILEVSTQLMQSLTIQGIGAVTLGESINAPLASIAEQANNINQRAVSNALAGRISQLTLYKPQ